MAPTIGSTQPGEGLNSRNGSVAEHVFSQNHRRYDPQISLSVTSVPLDCLSVCCRECDRRFLLVGLSAVPPSDPRAPLVVPPRNPAPDRRRLSLRPCRSYAHPQP